MKFTIVNSKYVLARYCAFAKDPLTVRWNDKVLEYVRGNENECTFPWKTVDKVYYNINLHDSHWVLTEIDLLLEQSTHTTLIMEW